MTRTTLIPAAVIILLMTQAGHAEDTSAAKPLLQADFKTSLEKSGWKLGGYNQSESVGSRSDQVSRSGRHCLTITQGWWESPAFAVKPFQYYRVRFHSMADAKGFWVVYFYDQDGKELIANHREAIYPSDEWLAHEFRFRGRLKGVTARIRFQAINEPIYVDDVTITPTTRDEVRDWADGLAKTLPSMNLDPGVRPGKLLARSMEKLRQAERLRIVMLGDSIINDTGNSPYDVLIERLYPGAQVEVINSVRGGTGCTYYQSDDRIESFVLEYQPDLLIIGGISHRYDAEAIRSVIRQVRKQSDPDILVMSGAVCPTDVMISNQLKYSKKLSREELQRRSDAYRPALEKMTGEEKVAYLDFRATWDGTVPHARKHPTWFHRDPVHANARGKQVLARILENYFRPAEPKK